MVGLAQFFDTDVSGSAHGRRKGGLTKLGRAVIKRAEEKGMIVDLAHASDRTIDDTLAVAATGGVIGIGLYEYAVCGCRVQDTVRAMRHVAGLVGVEHVALGSDFDGATTFVDASGLVLLTEALMKGGFTPAEIRKIIGENALRVLRQALPP